MAKRLQLLIIVGFVVIIIITYVKPFYVLQKFQNVVRNEFLQNRRKSNTKKNRN